MIRGGGEIYKFSTYNNFSQNANNFEPEKMIVKTFSDFHSNQYCWDSVARLA
jgi:hypothetical protein